MDPETYHRVLQVLIKKEMGMEWFLVYLLGQTGILVGELCQIRTTDLSFEGATKAIALSPVRGSKTVKVYHRISGHTAGVIERWVLAQEVQKGSRIFPFTKRTAQNMFKRAIEAAGVKEPYTTRSLRHMYALNVAAATEDEAAVARALRKRDLPSAKVYLDAAKTRNG